MIEPSSPMLRLFQYMERYYTRLSIGVSTSILNKVADLMPPLLVGWIIDTLGNNTPSIISSSTGSNDIWTNMIFLSALIVIIFAIESFFEWLYHYYFLTLAQDVQHDLRTDAYTKLQSRELAYYEENRTGNLMAMLNDDVNQLERFLNTSFNDIIQLIVLFIFSGIVLFGISWQLALLSMIPIPLILMGSIYYQKIIAPKYRVIRETVGQLSSRLENNISGILVIKSFTAEKFESQRVEKASADYRDANFKAIKLSTLYVPLIRMFIALGFAGAMLVAGYWITHGKGGITLGEITIFGMMVQRMLWPVTRLGRLFDEFERARASARRVFGLMDTPNQIDNPAPNKMCAALKGEIAFNQVEFHYSNQLPILRKLSFEVAAGESIGIAGTTGAGKTTLIKLLLRLYDVTGGSITIDGTDLRSMNLQQLRRHIALVSQDVYLFHGTIAENIAYGMENVSMEAIKEASRKAEFHSFVKDLPDQYDAIVGERGIKLSGGQRQRLSIARAILKNAPILILDEATSSVDTETERAIQSNLNQLIQGKTALIIAHRLSTLRRANKILVLKEGQIIEQGTHEDLLHQEGIYADLWKVQIGEII